MREIWNHTEDISVPDLIGNLNTKYGKGYARTTVTTFLTKIQARGFINTYRKGKLSYVHALVGKEEYREECLKEFVDFWYNGNVESIRGDLDAVVK